MLSLKLLYPSHHCTVVLLLNLTLWGIGCQKAALAPEQVVKDFLGHLSSGNAEKAWSLLSMDNRDRLQEHHEKLARAGHREPSRKPTHILYRDIDLDVPQSYHKVRSARPTEDTVKVYVEPKKGPTAIFYLKKEKERWRIDLLKTLIPIPTATVSTSSVGIGRDKDP